MLALAKKNKWLQDIGLIESTRFIGTDSIRAAAGAFLAGFSFAVVDLSNNLYLFVVLIPHFVAVGCYSSLREIIVFIHVLHPLLFRELHLFFIVLFYISTGWFTALLQSKGGWNYNQTGKCHIFIITYKLYT